jgi:drug/metabolite transporter (DMT)-like permease
MNSTSESKGIILMLISIFFFTVNTLAVRALALAIPACDGWVVTLFRGIAGTLVVLALYSRSGHLRLATLLNQPLMIARGLLGAIGVTLYYIAVIELGAARAVVINLSYPIFAALLARVVLKETLSTKQLFWITSGFLGLVIFLAPKALSSGVGFYDLVALAGAVTAAGVVVLIRKLHQSEHGSTIFASQAVYCALLAIPFTQGDPFTLSSTAIFYLFVAGLIVAAGQLTMTFAYRHLEVSKGASLQLLLPIATGLGAWIFFDETFGPIEFLGAALTLLATMMVNRRASKSLSKKLTNQSISS